MYICKVLRSPWLTSIAPIDAYDIADVEAYFAQLPAKSYDDDNAPLTSRFQAQRLPGASEYTHNGGQDRGTSGYDR